MDSLSSYTPAQSGEFKPLQEADSQKHSRKPLKSYTSMVKKVREGRGEVSFSKRRSASQPYLFKTLTDERMEENVNAMRPVRLGPVLPSPYKQIAQLDQQMTKLDEQIAIYDARIARLHEDIARVDEFFQEQLGPPPLTRAVPQGDTFQEEELGIESEGSTDPAQEIFNNRQDLSDNLDKLDIERNRLKEKSESLAVSRAALISIRLRSRSI